MKLYYKPTAPYYGELRDLAESCYVEKWYKWDRRGINLWQRVKLAYFFWKEKVEERVGRFLQRYYRDFSEVGNKAIRVLRTVYEMGGSRLAFFIFRAYVEFPKFDLGFEGPGVEVGLEDGLFTVKLPYLPTSPLWKELDWCINHDHSFSYIALVLKRAGMLVKRQGWRKRVDWYLEGELPEDVRWVIKSFL